MGLFKGKKKKDDEFKKTENTDIEASDLAEFNEFPEENYDEEDLPEMPSPKQKEEPKKNLSDEEEIEILKRKIAKKEKDMEEKRMQEENQNQGRGLSVTEVLDIIQANTNRNLELLYLIRKNYGV